MRHRLAAVLVATFLLLPACVARHVTPARGVDFRALGIAPAAHGAIPTRPAAPFPATIAIARLQDAGYASCTGRGSSGRAAVFTVREQEEAEQLDRIAKLPLVRSTLPLNRLILPERVGSERELREAAARVHADLLVLYTFDTVFGDENRVPVLSVLTLGVFPTRQARATTTASAALLDVRTGFVYALAEATEDAGQLTNSWTADSAVEQSRRRAERRALEKLVGQFETVWREVVNQYASGTGAPGWGGPPARLFGAEASQRSTQP